MMFQHDGQFKKKKKKKKKKKLFFLHILPNLIKMKKF